ncbi:Transposase [Phytophthora megakarya]|uniref:Transposase n=1 Tax=Phytophthora megakarya TaxID=4795 RepID=A0A225VNH9_9STRA|nr:Transposase [Phytophthora megakarya]
MRWWSIVLTYIYDIDLAVVALVIGVSTRSISRWGLLFRRRGNVKPNVQIKRKTRWPLDCIKFVKGFVEKHPCFYIEELQEALKTTFPALPNISTATICKALRFDLGLTRKVLTKRARKCAPTEIDAYYEKLASFYRDPEQLVFLDETAKDG